MSVGKGKGLFRRVGCGPPQRSSSQSARCFVSAQGENCTRFLAPSLPAQTACAGFAQGKGNGRDLHVCGPRSRLGKVRSAPFPPTGRRKLRPLPCPSSPHANRPAGFARGPHIAEAHVPGKNGSQFIRACGREYGRGSVRSQSGFLDRTPAFCYPTASIPAHPRREGGLISFSRR